MCLNSVHVCNPRQKKGGAHQSIPHPGLLSLLLDLLSGADEPTSAAVLHPSVARQMCKPFKQH